MGYLSIAPPGGRLERGYWVSMLTNEEHGALGAWAQHGRSARETPTNAHRGCFPSCGDPGTRLLCIGQFSLLFMGVLLWPSSGGRFGMKTPPFIQSHRLKQ